MHPDPWIGDAMAQTKFAGFLPWLRREGAGKRNNRKLQAGRHDNRLILRDSMGCVTGVIFRHLLVGQT